MYKGISIDQLKELLVEIPERKQDKNEEQREEDIKITRTNERSSLLRLESLDQIKRRDMLNKQKELTAQINEKKERARSAINISTGEKKQSQTSQSKMFLQKIKR
jgi:hypothetical protein